MALSSPKNHLSLVTNIYHLTMSYTSMNNKNVLKPSVLKTVFLLLITFLICDIGWSQSYTDREGDSINPKFYVWAGLFYPNMNTSLRVDSALGIGTEIGLENDLDLQEELGVFRLDGLVQLTENSQLAVTYTSMNREKRFTLQKNIEFGKTLFQEGSNVGYNFNVDYIGIPSIFMWSQPRSY